MGFIRGNETITLSNTYFVTRLRKLLITLAHVLLVMPGTIIRNYRNERQRGQPTGLCSTRRMCYILTVIVSTTIQILSSILDIALIVPTFVEYCWMLLCCPVGAILYPLTQRGDSISSGCFAVESLFPKVEFQKFDTVLEIVADECTGHGQEAGCGEFVLSGTYREIVWVCKPCRELLRYFQEHHAGPGILDRVHMRGHVVSEYCPWFHSFYSKQRLIKAEGRRLDNLRSTKFLLFRAYDIAALKWKRVYIRARARNEALDIGYEMVAGRDRTEQITYPLTEPEERIAVKAFKEVSKDWNKLYKREYNNRSRNFIKLAGAGILLIIQGSAGLLQIGNDENSALKFVTILVTVQLAWFQIFSEALLADLPDDSITPSNFDAVSTARARAIRYISSGDHDSSFSARNLSWFSGNLLVGSGVASPVTPIELLLNGNRLVTNDYLYNFANTGLTVSSQSSKSSA